MPLSRMENTTFAKPSITDSHDMGLRTVYSPDAQQKTPIQRLLSKSFANFSQGHFIPPQSFQNYFMDSSKQTIRTSETSGAIYALAERDIHIRRLHCGGLSHIVAYISKYRIIEFNTLSLYGGGAR
ncbi:hypothetical protein TNCV_4183731 [Trichonephila clavipes]|nr:hypothetical protein TNCV_4183731 [Trichonephila clavipes]